MWPRVGQGRKRHEWHLGLDVNAIHVNSQLPAALVAAHIGSSTQPEPCATSEGPGHQLPPHPLGKQRKVRVHKPQQRQPAAA